MDQLDQQLQAELDELKSAGLLRSLRSVDGLLGPRMTIDGRSVLEASSSNYLGLAGDARLMAAATRAIREHGCSAGGARLISGNLSTHEQLEEELADFLGFESALLFSTGYMANLGLVTALAGAGDVIFSDSLNHASIIDAARTSRAEIRVYPHNDMEELARIASSATGHRRRFLIADGVFSMDGDAANIKELRQIANRCQLFLMVDDAHGIGVLGPNCRGVCEQSGCSVMPDVLIGNLGKALGSFGAFVACSRTVREYLINRSRPFIFTCGLAPALSAAALAGLQVIRSEPERGAEVLRLANRLRAGLRGAGFDTLTGETHIVPVIIGDNETTMRIADEAWAQEVHIQGIRYPSVPRGTSRLRITPNFGHTPADMDLIVELLSRLRPECGSHFVEVIGSKSRLERETRPVQESCKNRSSVPDHTIRLRGPWEIEGQDQQGQVRVEKVTFPFDPKLLQTEWQTPQRMWRNFGRPTGLEKSTRVELCVDGLPFSGTVLLNNLCLAEDLPAGGDFRLDISQRLQERNTLSIEIHGSQRLTDCLSTDVRLEIFEDPQPDSPSSRSH